MNQVIPIDLGLIDYKKAWDFQEELFQKSIQQKIALRNGTSQEKTKNYLIFCQHPHVYTLGKSGSSDHLLLNINQLKEKKVSFYHINRGGDITYHGPGQLVVYPIFDLDHFFTDIHKYMRFLEASVIQTLREFGIIAESYPSYTGVWLELNSPNVRKICAMGVKSSRWVTMHGLALNINSNLSYFSHIIPCGIEDKSVTSMQKELGMKVDFEKVVEVFKEKIAQQFQFEYIINDTN